MGKIKNCIDYVTGRNYKFLEIFFGILFIIIFFVFLLSWCDATIPIVNTKIDKTFLQHWIPLCTLFAFCITLYKQLDLANKLDIQKRAVVSTNNKICLGLIDDILSIISSMPSNKTSYHAINRLRERIEIHLEYCQGCCSEEAKKDYNNWSASLNRYEHQLRAKIKSTTKVNFDDNKFVKDMTEFKKFLVQKDNLILN